MKKSVMLFSSLVITIIILSLDSCKNASPREKAVLGDWYTIKGDVDAYSFMKDNGRYIFTGTQDRRPVVYGSWKIIGDKFVITTDNGTEKAYLYSIVNDTMIFNGGEEIYTRTLPLEIRFPEVRILKDLASAFSSHKFSGPYPVTFSWDVWSDSIHSLKEIPLKGYRISMGSSLVSDDMENLSGFLSDHGFTRDTLFNPGICIGLLDENQLVTLCKNQDPALPADSINIFVSSAIIK